MRVLNCVLEHHVLILCTLFIEHEAYEDDFNLLLFVTDILQWYLNVLTSKRWMGSGEMEWY